MKNFKKGGIAKETERSSCVPAFILGYAEGFLHDFGQVAQGLYGLLLTASLSCRNTRLESD